jgi:hypothetical protein
MAVVPPMIRGGLMGDLIFVVVTVAFFAISVAYVKGCERIVGRDTGAELLGDPDADGDSTLDSTLGRAR